MRTLNSGRLVRRLGIVIAMAIGMTAFALRPAAAQAPLAEPIAPDRLAARLSRAGVAIPPERFVEAWLRYAERFQEEVLPACEARLANDPPDEEAPDIRYMGVARELRRQALDDQILAAEDRLREALFAELLEATARPADRVVVEQCRDLESVVQAMARTSAAIPGWGSLWVPDVGNWLASERVKDADLGDRSVFRTRIELAASAAQERRRAYLDARKFIFERCAEDARELERALDGRSYQQAMADEREIFMSQGRRSSPGQPGKKESSAILRERLPDWSTSDHVRDRILAGQRAACTAIAERLDPALRARFFDGWFARIAGATKPPSAIRGLDDTRDHEPIGPIIAQLTLTPDLSVDGRRRLHKIGRAWIADDRAIRASAFDAWLLTGVIPDTMPERNARAIKARAAIGAIEGLAFFANESASIEITREALLDPEWCEGFTQEINRGIAMVKAMPVYLSRIPEGYLPEDQALLADLLGLDDRKRGLFAEMFEHARRRWENEVGPIAADLSPERLIRTTDSDQLRRTYDDARAAADSIDREIAASVAAVLDVPEADPILEWYRVARQASLGAGRQHRTPSVAAVLLHGPMSVEGRRAAILAAFAALADVRAAMETSAAADRARQEFSQAARERRMSTGDSAARYQAVEAQEKAAEAGYVRAQDALRSAVAPALRDQDAVRWAALSAWTTDPASYADLAALWSSVDRLLQCLDDAERPVLQPQIAAIETRCTELLRALGDRTRAASQRLGRPPSDFLRPAIRWGIESVASSPIVLLVPERCAPKPAAPTSYFRLAPALARLRTNCDDAAAAPPTRAP